MLHAHHSATELKLHLQTTSVQIKKKYIGTTRDNNLTAVSRVDKK